MNSNIWFKELDEIEKLSKSFQIEDVKLVKELDSLINSQNDEVTLLYSRRALEVIITNLCLNKLCRDRGNEPLSGVIDKLNREKVVPEYIYAAMQNLNRIATFGAHPKDFDPNQVRTSILELATILRWFFSEKKYAESKKPVKPEKKKPTQQLQATDSKPAKFKISFGIILLIVIAISIIIFLIIQKSSNKEIANINNLEVANLGTTEKQLMPAKSQNSIKEINNSSSSTNSTSEKPKPDTVKTVLVSSKAATPKTEPKAKTETAIKSSEPIDANKLPAKAANIDVTALFQKLSESKIYFAERKKISQRILNEFDSKAVVSITLNNQVVDRMGAADYVNRLLLLQNIDISIGVIERNASEKITKMDVSEQKIK